MSDSTAIATTQAGGAMVEAQSESAMRFQQTLAMIREAMFNPDVDAAKAKVMADLMNGQEDRLLLTEFNRDLNAAIMDMPVITKAGIITIPAKDGKPERTQGRFARFEDIDRVVRPILDRHRLSIRFDIGEVGGKVSVRPIIGHRNGQTWIGEAMTAPLDTSGAKNNVQGAGSTVSYLKRYTMCAALNIVTEGTDDDGSLGKFAIGMTHEREVTVLEEAEEAHANGRYTDWFKEQSHKDRGWMVSSGHHSRLGGAPALPDASRADGADSGPQPQQEASQRDTLTAKGWTDKYVAECEEAGSLEELQRIQVEGADSLARLKEAAPRHHQRAVQAGTTALARLTGGDL
jgi:hypothetical protein